jgi:hypothetical protein
LIASVTLLVEMKETGTLFIGSRNNYCKWSRKNQIINKLVLILAHRILK